MIRVNIDMSDPTLQIVKNYHQQTKHRPGAYARSAGYMDWANQPLPYRLYQGSEKINLPLNPKINVISAVNLFQSSTQAAEIISLDSIARLLQNSLGLSAWKSYNGTEWALRINPSSGNLHPTECYLLLPDLLPASSPEHESTLGTKSEHKKAYSVHYNPYINSLEKRALLSDSDADFLNKKQGFAVVLSSIAWREAWKYGERAYRYCQHDLGHALAALTIAANLNGWKVEILDDIPNKKIASILGINQSIYAEQEKEYVDCICWVSSESSNLEEVTTWLNNFSNLIYQDQANKLSQSHQDWPIIDDVFNAGHQQSFCFIKENEPSLLLLQDHTADISLLELSAEKIIQQRRSAQSFDAVASVMPVDRFISQLQKTLPEQSIPFSVLPQQAQVHLVLFVHNVQGLASGLYIWVRNQRHLSKLKSSMHANFEWSQSVNSQPLYLLKKGDYRKIAKALSCDQDIAAESAYSLGMLARFEDNLAHSASQYPVLFWETGLIGQVLYLAAECDDLRATGIGCFFDDLVHELLGLKDLQWQSLYHFTVGKQIDDARISTKPAYFHLQTLAE